MKNKHLSHFGKIKDHSVSGETFDLLYQPDFDMLITSPQPPVEKLPGYYASEDYISHTDGRRTIFEKIYQAVKTLSLSRKVRIVNKHALKGNMLDLGAGTGDFVAAAGKDGWTAIGVEPSDNARVHAASKGIHLLPTSSDIPDHSQDVISMWHVLEHVPDPHWQVSELKRMVKPGGVLIVAVPNFKAYDATVYGEFWAAYDVPRHLHHFSQTSIRMLFSDHRFQVRDVLPMPFDAFYVSLLSEKYKTGKMRVLPAFWNGLRSNLKASRSGEYSSLIYIITDK